MITVPTPEADFQFPVVGIGASAGGLEAFKLFLQALPKDSGMAYVFIQHLSPNHISVLPDILEKVSPIPVQQITDNIHLKPDHLYIIPANKIVTAFDGALKLEPFDKNLNQGKTIDLFFSSLATVHQSYSIGIILSGALHDGTVGLQMIKSYGGITFAQDEGSAAFDSMPASAIKAGAIDFVLSPQEIAHRLIEINHLFNSTSSRALSSLPEADTDIFKRILTLIQVRRGVDFQYYKSSTLKRRIIRRMALSSIEKPAEYLTLLRDNKVEQDSLYDDMLISVTEFFRDPQSFATLCNTIFPKIISQKKGTEPLRIWVAGCATGEEAYSIAICLQELYGEDVAGMKTQIFATDISEVAIAKARSGAYKTGELTGLSPARVQKFFTKQDDNYQVNKATRDMCVFAHHNMLKNPPFSKIDVVSCRNVLIYFEPILQNRAITTFHYSLKENGFLILGRSETIGINTESFSLFNKNDKIYSRIGPIGKFMTVTSQNSEQGFRNIDKDLQMHEGRKDLFKVADDALLINFMPPSVVVNERNDIVQFRGSTDTWLALPTGKPTLNVLKMAREGLAFELKNLLSQAKKTRQTAGKHNILFKLRDAQHTVAIKVYPLEAASESYFLIIFQDHAERIPTNGLSAGSSTDSSRFKSARIRIEQLEKELLQSRTDMRAITEEQESAYEELQSANEELLSGNEEMQSLNEELETSKEELQSTNEEISIVNQELLERNSQLNNARLYAEAVVTTIRDPLIILDQELHIKRATDGFYRKFRLTERDCTGQLFFDLSSKIWDIPSIHDLLEGVLPQSKATTNLEVELVFPVVGRKVLLINAMLLDHTNGEKLIVLSIEDITARRQIEEGLLIAENLLSESKERLSSAVESAGFGTWDFNPNDEQVHWDLRARELSGATLAATVDYAVFLSFIHREDRNQADKSIKEALKKDKNCEFEIEYRTCDILQNTLWLRLKGKAYFDSAGIANRLVGTIMDVTARKQLQEATLELIKKKDEFISIASHELKTPITSLNVALQLIELKTAGQEALTGVHYLAQKASRQIAKLIELVKNLLDVTKIQSGKLELFKSYFPIKTLIVDAVEEILAGAPERKIEIFGDAATTIYADRNRLEQVLINLLSNAIKYSPGDEPVNVQISHTENMLRVTIEDHGIGIEKHKIPFIFDRFFRVEATSQNFTGLGLGLFITSEIIKQHEGTIGVDSDGHTGSTFWFTIPWGPSEPVTKETALVEAYAN